MPKNDINKRAADLYHTLYPRTNFYEKTFVEQRKFIDSVREYEIRYSRNT